MTTVLVTGVSGHVGGHLARRVQEGGVTVRALVRTVGQAESARLQGWQPVQGDLTDPATLTPALEGVDAVLHSAAYGGPPSPLYQKVNIDGTRELARRALESGAQRFVHISTISVYGEPLPSTVDEESPLATEDPEPYCATKAKAELELQKVRERGLPVTILRPGMITHWVRSQWGNEMVERIRSKGWPPFLHPDDVLPWVHSLNLAEMSWLAITREAAADDGFLAVDQNVRVRDFYGPVARVLGQPMVVPDRAPNISHARLGKIGSGLGYTPLHSFEETVSRLVDLALRRGEPAG